MALTSNEQVLAHVERIHSLSEVRTPLICCLENGDPVKSIEVLAKRQGLTVWKISMDTPKNEQNALDYLQVGLQNGDWLYLTQCEKATTKVMREIALQLFTVAPDPKNYPKREFFRLWLLVEQPIDINDNVNPIFPAVLTQHALLAWREISQNKNKVICKQKVDPLLAESQMMKKVSRKDRGQDSDDESDEEGVDPAKKQTGMWFHRAVDFFTADADNAVTKSVENIFDAIEKGEVETVKDIIAGNTLDLNQIAKAGLTPLLWAIMCDNIAMVRLLLDSEADPNLRRVGNGMPPIFMSIEEPELLQLLIDYGADIDARFEGKTLMDHPDTAPSIREYIKNYLR
eukprot:NODE_2547_length_1392_cov_182.699764_g2420_i0.p1 GENE.NODE_2547_length_1392_cov_182.699764_g2420_i0~~NODE_2547_length_1392_cov_182.699764_g2420_i0.p1  ORF type:complete len:343 (+),score=71.83 NODE_2547_length_1392_cov_182.699764_g2420_i0:109-1137(+)